MIITNYYTNNNLSSKIKQYNKKEFIDSKKISSLYFYYYDQNKKVDPPVIFSKLEKITDTFFFKKFNLLKKEPVYIDIVFIKTELGIGNNKQKLNGFTIFHSNIYTIFISKQSNKSLESLYIHELLHVYIDYYKIADNLSLLKTESLIDSMELEIIIKEKLYDI